MVPVDDFIFAQRGMKCLNTENYLRILVSSFDVITSLVSLEHGVYSWENVTSE
jgi:hypothetical protein